MLVVTALPNVGLRLWLGSVITSLAVHGGGKVAELRAASRGQQSRPGHPPLDIRPAPLQTLKTRAVNEPSAKFHNHREDPY